MNTEHSTLVSNDKGSLWESAESAAAVAARTVEMTPGLKPGQIVITVYKHDPIADHVTAMLKVWNI
jgi:hypothetical protein